MKRIVFVFALFCTLAFNLPAMAQNNYNDAKYLAGAVSVENGMVVFTENFQVPGKSQAEILTALEAYTKSLLKAEYNGVQSRITEITPETGIIAASLEQTLTFKSTNWILDTARCFFQLVFEAKDGEFNATFRRIRYLYTPMDINGIDNTLTAEDWITDKNALNKKGQLTKVGGKKFRFATINRKNEIFAGALQSVKQ